MVYIKKAVSAFLAGIIIIITSIVIMTSSNLLLQFVYHLYAVLLKNHKELVNNNLEI